MILPKYKPKDIPSYERLYAVTEDGKVYSFRKRKFLKLAKNNRGYLFVNLSQNGKIRNHYIHRIVAQTLIPNPNNYPQVNHKDENPRNNHVSNLEWCTAKYNSNYGIRNKKVSEKNKGKKLSEETKNKISKAQIGRKQPMQDKHHTEETKNKISELLKGKYTRSINPNTKKVRCIETGQIFDSVSDANEFLGKNRRNSNIVMCLKGKNKTAYKLHWEYVE